MKIPRKIYQSWKDKKLDPKMSAAVENIKKLNPDYEYELHDNIDCRKFILENYGINYANAFDTLIPGAFKGDFWRYAILYKYGGVYIDIDMVPFFPLDTMIGEDDEFISVQDLHLMSIPNNRIFQAFIACTPRHPIVWYSLQISFSNIVSRIGGVGPLFVTGPGVMGIAFNLYMKNTNTYTPVYAGRYGNIVLLTHHASGTIKNLDGKDIMNTKYEGYSRGDHDYGSSAYYVNEPPNVRKIAVISIKVLLISIIILLSVILIYMYKYRKCVNNCNINK